MNDCLSDSVRTTDMFEMSAHACLHNKNQHISSSVHGNQSAAAQFLFCNPNMLTVFTNVVKLKHFLVVKACTEEPARGMILRGSVDNKSFQLAVKLKDADRNTKHMDIDTVRMKQ